MSELINMLFTLLLVLFVGLYAVLSAGAVEGLRRERRTPRDQ